MRASAGSLGVGCWVLMLDVTVRHLEVSIGGIARILRGVSLTVPDRTSLLPHGPQWRRQDHHAQVHHRPAETERAAPSVSTGKTSRAGRPTRGPRAGIGYVPQGRDIFPYLTVEENLKIGAIAQRQEAQRPARPRLRALPDPQGISSTQRRHAQRRPAAATRHRAARCSPSRSCSSSTSRPKAFSRTSSTRSATRSAFCAAKGE